MSTGLKSKPCLSVTLNYLSKKQLLGFLKNIDSEKGYKQFMNTIWYIRRKMSEQLQANKIEEGTPGHECLTQMFEGLNWLISDTLDRDAAKYPPFRDTAPYNHYSH